MSLYLGPSVLISGGQAWIVRPQFCQASISTPDLFHRHTQELVRRSISAVLAELWHRSAAVVPQINTRCYFRVPLRSIGLFSQSEGKSWIWRERTNPYPRN